MHKFYFLSVYFKLLYCLVRTTSKKDFILPYRYNIHARDHRRMKTIFSRHLRESLRPNVDFTIRATQKWSSIFTMGNAGYSKAFWNIFEFTHHLLPCLVLPFANMIDPNAYKLISIIPLNLSYMIVTTWLAPYSDIKLLIVCLSEVENVNCVVVTFVWDSKVMLISTECKCSASTATFR